jgi:hypothetical protein
VHVRINIIDKYVTKQLIFVFILFEVDDMFRPICQAIKYILLEKAIERKLCNQMHGTNFQRNLVGVHLTNINRKKYVLYNYHKILYYYKI